MAVVIPPSRLARAKTSPSASPRRSRPDSDESEGDRDRPRKRQRQRRTQLSGVRVHRDDFVEGKKKLRCQFEDCEESFGRPTERNKHHRLHERPVLCKVDGCEETFSHNRQLKRHIQSNHPAEAKAMGIAEGGHRCSKCGKEFTRPDNVMKHQNGDKCKKILVKSDEKDQDQGGKGVKKEEEGEGDKMMVAVVVKDEQMDSDALSPVKW